MKITNANQQDHWLRAIILIDMDAFFAAIEQRDYPELRGRPIGITNGREGTCLITTSYEARAYGVKTGMRLREAKQRCPHLIALPSRPKLYAETSRNIMTALESITPDMEIFSVDEAFLDVTHCQKTLGTPEILGKLAKQKVKDVSGLTCSIGISGDKTTAKYAAKLNKPNGFNIIAPWEMKQTLKDVPVSELCGIGQGITAFLARYNVVKCGDMEKLPISILAKRFGNLGRRIWLMCQGADPEPMHKMTDNPKSMGHGKVMPPNTNDKKVLLTYLHHMCVKLATRLRCHQMYTQYLFIGWKSYSQGWIGRKAALVAPSHDSKKFYQLGRQILEEMWNGQAVYQIQVTALDPSIGCMQRDLFVSQVEQSEKLNQVIDHINARYGEFAIAPAPLLNRSRMHNVIAPAWKPFGHRQSVK